MHQKFQVNSQRKKLIAFLLTGLQATTCLSGEVDKSSIREEGGRIFGDDIALAHLIVEDCKEATPKKIKAITLEYEGRARILELQAQLFNRNPENIAVYGRINVISLDFLGRCSKGEFNQANSEVESRSNTETWATLPRRATASQEATSHANALTSGHNDDDPYAGTSSKINSDEIAKQKQIFNEKKEQTIALAQAATEVALNHVRQQEIQRRQQAAQRAAAQHSQSTVTPSGQTVYATNAPKPVITISSPGVSPVYSEGNPNEPSFDGERAKRMVGEPGKGLPTPVARGTENGQVYQRAPASPIDQTTINRPNTYEYGTASSCFTLINTEKKNYCGNDNGKKVTFANGCQSTIELKFCNQRKDGSPDCGAWTLKPGKTDWIWYCDWGTGKIAWSACYKSDSDAGTCRLHPDRDATFELR